MSEAGNFDDFIKREFNKYSPEVPTHIWDNIVAERERKRPKGLWLNFLNSKNILLLTGLLLAGGTATWLFSTYRTQPSKNIITIAATNEKTNTPLIKPENNSINTNDQLSGGDSKRSEKNTGTTTAPSSIKTVEPADHPVASIASITGKKTNSTPYTKRGWKNKNNSGIAYQDNNDFLISQEEAGVNDTEAFTQGSISGRLALDAQRKSEQNEALTGIKTNSFPHVALPECPTFEKDAAGNKKYFEFYAGPDYAIKHLTDTANSAYLQKRKESTSFTSAFSAGARYTRVFKNCMSVRVGLNYSQINEKFSFVQGNVIQVTYVIDPLSGDTTAAYTVRGSQHRTTYNHYKSIDIPLALGYEFGYGRLHANINAGAIVNVYGWQKGEVLDTNNNPVSITTGKGSPDYQYKTNLGVSLSGGIAAYYKLNDVLHLLAEPYIRYNLSSMSKEDDYMTLRQKFTTIGCRLGIRLDIK